MPQFMADQHLRQIHWLQENAATPCIEAVAGPDRLDVDEEDDVKRMMELEAFRPCPHCMANFPWSE